jgi:hypothetical protein
MTSSTHVSVPSPSPGREGASGGPGLEWSFNPWRERPGHSLVAALIAVALCAALMSLRQERLLTIALSVAAIFSLSPLYSPARCRVDDVGAARGGPLGWERRRWEEIRRAVLSPPVLALSPYTTHHWLDRYRALMLPLPARDRDRLVAELRPMLQRHGL